LDGFIGGSLDFTNFHGRLPGNSRCRDKTTRRAPT
jgi:hypothetical protein